MHFIIKEKEKEIKCSAAADPLACLPFYYTTLLSSFLVLEDFTTCCPSPQCSPSHPLLVALSIRMDYGLL